MQRSEEIPDGKAGEFRGALKAKTLRGILSQALNRNIVRFIEGAETKRPPPKAITSHGDEIVQASR
jgi:hypothetical protein